MENIKDELREVIIHMTAEKMAPLLISKVPASKLEMIETFKRLVDSGRVKIGIMPFQSEGQDQFHSVTLFKTNARDRTNSWKALETGKPVELKPETERVFTMTEEQYQQVYGHSEIH